MSLGEINNFHVLQSSMAPQLIFPEEELAVTTPRQPSSTATSCRARHLNQQRRHRGRTTWVVASVARPGERKDPPQWYMAWRKNIQTLAEEGHHLTRDLGSKHRLPYSVHQVAASSNSNLQPPQLQRHPTISPHHYGRQERGRAQNT